MQFITTLVALCAAASAITITSPARDNSPRPVQYNNGSITITWTSSPGEPTSLDVVLSTNNGQSLRTVASGVATSAGSYAVDLTGVAPGQNYAVNLNNDPASGSSGILAQSGTFTVAQGEAASSTSAAATSSTTAAASSSTMATSGMVTSSAAPSASGTASAAPVPATSSAANSGTASTASGASIASGAATSGASGTSQSAGASGTSAGSTPSSTTASGAITFRVGSFAVAAVAFVTYLL